MGFFNKILLHNFNTYKIFNTFLRIFPVGLKFIFLTILSKFLSLADYGNFLLITTTITLAVFFLGLDFYNYSVRDILQQNKNECKNKIVSSFLFYGLVYFIFICVGYFTDLMFNPWGGRLNVFTVMFLCVTEHLNHEIYRLQVAFKKVLLANSIFFLRVFAWAGYFTVKLIFFEGNVNVNEILSLWLVSNIGGIFISLLQSVLYSKTTFKELKINWSFIKVGISVCFLFFIGTIALKSIEYVNRYMVEFILGEENTAIFIFYSNIAMSVTMYINAAVVTFELPLLLESTTKENQNQQIKKFERALLVQLVFISVLICTAIFPLLKWQGTEEYRQHVYILFFLLAGVFLMNYSLCYHFYLYNLKKDKLIVLQTFVLCLVNLLLTFLFTKYFKLPGAGISFAITGLFMLILRKKFAVKFGYNE